jgi:D-alanine-D-alanine ligase
VTIRRSRILIKSYADKPWRNPETYQLIEDSLREKWRVHSINTKNPDTLYSFLDDLRQEYGDNLFVFNIAEYLDETNRKGFLPALLDEWNIPHLGSSSEAVAIGLDKERTKKLLSRNQIPTARYFVANRGDSDNKRLAEKIGYPLFVKPVEDGGHNGIGVDSIVYDYASLEKAVDRVFDNFNQPALVEEYITGKGMREFSVGIIAGETRISTPVEIDYESMGVKIPILSYEAAKRDLERIMLLRDGIIRDEIIDLAERTFTAVGARDYSRVDIRMNPIGCYVLEINIMPGLGPHSFLPEAAKDIHDLEYNQLIQKLAEDSMERQKNRKLGSAVV